MCHGGEVVWAVISCLSPIDKCYREATVTFKPRALKFEEEFGMQHADENEATHIHAHAPVDAHGPNLVVHENVQSTKSMNKAKQHEKIVPSMHASLGIDSVHGSKIIHKMDLDEKEFGTFSNLHLAHFLKWFIIMRFFYQMLSLIKETPTSLIVT